MPSAKRSASLLLARALGVVAPGPLSCKFRMPEIPLHLASKGQIQEVLEGARGTFVWPTAQTLFVAWDHTQKSHYALIQADEDPPTMDIMVDEDSVVPTENLIALSTGATQKAFCGLLVPCNLTGFSIFMFGYGFRKS